MTEGLYSKIYGCLVGGLIGDAMGGPSELMDYPDVETEFGWIEDFEGSGTDDSAIKLILTRAILNNGGNITADEWAESFLEIGGNYYPLFYVPVKNMLHKIESHLTLPVYAGMGNVQSSSSAMAIAPLGIVNACDPRRAAMEAYDVAGLIHAGEATFCRDGASAVAAAIAEAMKPEATPDSVVDAAVTYLHKTSSKLMIDLIQESLELVRGGMSYQEYRAWYYANRLQVIHCDSRETVPAALTFFWLAKGDPCLAIPYSANFGRDADTIGTMVGAIAGAFRGIEGFRKDWVERIESYYNTVQDISSEDYGALALEVPDYREISRSLLELIRERRSQYADFCRMVDSQL